MILKRNPKTGVITWEDGTYLPSSSDMCRECGYIASFAVESGLYCAECYTALGYQRPREVSEITMEVMIDQVRRWDEAWWLEHGCE